MLQLLELTGLAMPNFTPQQVSGGRLQVMDLSKAGTNILSPYSNALHNEAVMAQKKASAATQAAYRNQQQLFQNEQADKTAEYRTQQAAYQNEQAMASKANRAEALRLQQAGLGLKQKAYDRQTGIMKAQDTIAGLDPTVPIAKSAFTAEMADEVRKDAIAGLRLQAKRDTEAFNDTARSGIEAQDALTKYTMDYGKRLREEVAHTNPAKRTAMIKAGMREIGRLKAEVANVKLLPKPTNIQGELASNIAAVNASVVESKQAPLTVPQYRAEVTKQLQSQIGKGGEYTTTALNKRINELTNNYQASLQKPLEDKKAMQTFGKKEKIKNELAQSLALVKKKGSKVINRASVIEAEERLKTLSDNWFGMDDDEKKDYAKSLGVYREYIEKWNASPQGKLNPKKAKY